MSEVYAEQFSSLVEKAKAVSKPIKVALAGADSENMLKAIFDAEADGFVKPILIGNREKIHNILKNLGLTDREYDLQPINDDTNAVQYAIEMINAGKANCLMRGNTQTKDFLLPVLNKMNHLIREGALVTHVTFLKAPEQDHVCAYSDVTLLVKPSVEQRKQVVRNMVRALGVFDLHQPKIALLDLVETPSFNLRNSIENQGIVIEHRKRPIADCELVGPIPYDLIVSKEAARLKGYDCPYCGEFDGVVVPDLMSGNLLIKVLQHSCHATGYGILVGAKVPIAISSRSDSPEQSYLSLAACAVMKDSKDPVYFA